MRECIFTFMAIGFLITACDEQKQTADRCYFNAPFPDKEHNLWWVLGNDFALVNENDTAFYKLEFIEDLRYNLITTAELGDTVFCGPVAKHKGYYIFSSRVEEGLYDYQIVDIHKGAFKRSEYMRGFPPTANCMWQLDSLLEEDSVLQALIDSSGKGTVLRPEKKLIFAYLETMLDEQLTFPLIARPDNSAGPGNAGDSGYAEVRKTDSLVEKGKLIKNYFPNPVEESLTLEPSTGEVFSIEVFSIEGNSMFRKTGLKGRQIIDFSNFKSGTYLLRLSTGEQSEEVRIVHH